MMNGNDRLFRLLGNAAQALGDVMTEAKQAGFAEQARDARGLYQETLLLAARLMEAEGKKRKEGTRV